MKIVIRKKVKKDDVFIHYTGNMFGIGCSVFSQSAINRIKELKQREGKKGLIVLLENRSWLEEYNIPVSIKMNRLLQQYWPGELTLILPDPRNNFKNLSVDGKVAFRIPTDVYLQNFIKKQGCPIVSTSINVSGQSAENDIKTIRSKYRNWFDHEILPKRIVKNSYQPSTIIQEEKGELLLVREGEIEFKEIERSWQKPRILFVCTANICRSPMAHYYLKKVLEDHQLSFEVRSAGFLQSNVRISQNSYETLKENGMDAEMHISTQLSTSVVSKSWLILTMTKNHKLNLIDHFPAAAGKVFTLSEYSGFQQDIDDPYGLDIYHYRQTYNKIKKRIDSLLEKLMKEEA